MPKKLKILIVLVGVGILSHVLAHNWIGTALNLAMLAGLLKGNEGVRNTLKVIAALGLILGGLMLLGAFALHVPSTMRINLILTGGVSFGVYGYLLWCLRQHDVEMWMFNKSVDEK